MTEFVDIGFPTRVRIPNRDEVLQLPDDAYPALYFDQRHMVPGGLGGDEGGEQWGPCETAEDVYQCWARHLAKTQQIEPHPDELNREVVPYLTWAQWVADCPACGSGMACWDRNPYACCLGLGCGRIYKVVWQVPMVRSEIMRILAAQPVEHRNWDAHKDETAEELIIRNVLTLGVPAAERNGLLMAENVVLPDELSDPLEYLDHMRRARRKV